MKTNKKIKIILMLICLFSVISIFWGFKIYDKNYVENEINNNNILAVHVTVEDGGGEFIPESTTDIDYNNICSNVYMTNAMRIVGYVIRIVCWFVPLLIIVLGMVDFGRAALSNDEKAINKATTALIRRVIAGIVVFLLPTIIMAALNIVFPDEVQNEKNSNFGRCTKCLFDPSKYCK